MVFFRLRFKRFWIFVFFAFVNIQLTISLAGAATLTVLNTGDSGAGSLRQAVADAMPGDIIEFNPTVFPDVSTGIITLSSGELVINTALTINGDGRVAIDGNGNSRIFNLNDGLGPNIDILLTGLTLTGGNADFGGAIRNYENLTLLDTIVDANTATQHGGGIYNAASAGCTIVSSVISGNSAADGGGIYNHTGSFCDISGSTMDSNSSTAYGGAIHNYEATCSINSSTLSYNTAFRAGGVYSLRSTLNITNSTISSNTASENSGALFNERTPSTIKNSTIVSNAGVSGGAAVVNRYSEAVCSLTSSIIANNYPRDLWNLDGGSATADYSLIENPSGHSITDGETNIVGQDPLLGPLKNYGGPTTTHVLLGISPAIDSGANPDSLVTDQRGFPRVADGYIDMGAVEGSHDGNFLTITVDSRSDSGAGSLRQAIADAMPGDIIEFDPAIFPDVSTGIITLSSGELVIDKTLTIDGDGRVTINGNGSSRIFNLDDGLGSNINILLTGLTLTGGYADFGGAIRNYENLTLLDTIVDTNIATVNGGGIYNTAWADCTIMSSSISENIAARGGGIYNDISSVCTVTDSIITSNSSSHDGGGIYNTTSSVFTVTNSTVGYNLSSGNGGGIHNHWATCSVNNSALVYNTASRGAGVYNLRSTFSLSNSTISSNAASENSGAIYSERSPSTINNSTIVANTGLDGSGAVYNRYSEAQCSLTSSIVAGNYPRDLWNVDGSSTTADYSLIENPEGHLITDGGTNIVGQDPMLFALGDYGGPTLTHAIKDGSPAIGGGSNPNQLRGDQRERGGGFPRQVDTVDMGAVEYNANTALTVQIAGSGSGTVTSSPTGIDCVADCEATFDPNTTVTLTASPGTETVFTGWSDGCSGTGPCTVSMDQARSVTATFTLNTYNLAVSVTGGGTGIVSSSPAGISCGADCSESYDYNTSVELFAVPGSGSTFSGWSGACGGTGSCSIIMDQALSIAASFSLNTYTVQANAGGSGSGTVSSDAGGINYSYPSSNSGTSSDLAHGSSITLTAIASPGSSVSWSGCDGTGGTAVEATCTFSSLGGNKTVTATFGLNGYTVQANAGGNGIGTVSSNVGGINYSYPSSDSGTSSDLAHGSSITLTAIASTGFSVSWSDCDVTGGNAVEATCTFSSLDGNKTVTATFAVDTYNLTVQLEGTGNGTVTSNPEGIDCGTDCAQSYAGGTIVTLTAVPELMSSFKGWSGACSGSELTCDVFITQAVLVGAEFGSTSFAWNLFLPTIISNGKKQME